MPERGGEGSLGPWGWRPKCLEERRRQREGRREPLTSGTPSDHRKSPSMVLSLSPIHWYSRYRSGEEPQDRQCAMSAAAGRWRPFPGIPQGTAGQTLRSERRCQQVAPVPRDPAAGDVPPSARSPLSPPRRPAPWPRAGRDVVGERKSKKAHARYRKGKLQTKSQHGQRGQGEPGRGERQQVARESPPA